MFCSRQVNMISPKSPQIPFYNSNGVSDCVQVICSEKGKIFVNFRTFFCEKLTRFGVCLSEEEFKELLPSLERKESYGRFGTRSVAFYKSSPSLYTVKLVKQNGVQSMKFNEESLKGLIEKIEEIKKFFGQDVVD